MNERLRPYKCRQCEKTYKTSASLASHRYRVHPQTSDNSSVISELSSVSTGYSYPETENCGKVENLSDDFHTTIENIRSAIYELRDVFDDLESKVSKNEKSIAQIMKKLSENATEISNESSGDSDTESLRRQQEGFGKLYLEDKKPYKSNYGSSNSVSSESVGSSDLMSLQKRSRLYGL